MSQPLYITVIHGDDRVLRCYKRWSAFTEDAILLALEFSDNWEKTFRKRGVTKESILRCALASWDDCGVNSHDLPLLAQLGFGDPSGVPEESEEATIAVTPERMDARSCCGEISIRVGRNGDLSFGTDVCYVDEDDDDREYAPASTRACRRAVDDIASGQEVDAVELQALYDELQVDVGLETPSGHRLMPVS